MTNPNMKTIRFYLCLLPILTLMGCNNFELVAHRIQFQDEDAPALVTTEYINISSNETELEEVNSDFNDIVQAWKGDDFIARQAADGLYIKNREVFIHDDKLIGRVEGLISRGKVDESFEFQVSKGERILLLGGGEVIETNGKVVKTEKNILIVWKEDAKDIHWKVRSTDLPEPFEKNREFMIKKFKDYLLNQEQLKPVLPSPAKS